MVWVARWYGAARRLLAGSRPALPDRLYARGWVRVARSWERRDVLCRCAPPFLGQGKLDAGQGRVVRFHGSEAEAEPKFTLVPRGLQGRGV
jgi:hypothetical protein